MSRRVKLKTKDAAALEEFVQRLRVFQERSATAA
jgi:hypothetical protein